MTSYQNIEWGAMELTKPEDEKTERNKRVQARYDELKAEGKHGHYETLFRVVQEEVERDLTGPRVVHLVSTGCYSDYTIRGVYSTPELAERAKDLYDGETKEMTLDEMPDAPDGMVSWLVTMNRHGDTFARRTHAPEVDDQPRIHAHSASVTFEVWAVDEKHAVKIANERRIGMLAMNQWPKEAPRRPVFASRHYVAATNSVEAADAAYARLVEKVGEEAAIAKVRKFQKHHHLDPGAPIWNTDAYIAALDDPDYDPDRPIKPTEEGMRRYPHAEGRYEGEPCTCLPSCPKPCGSNWSCHCVACSSAAAMRWTMPMTERNAMELTESQVKDPLYFLPLGDAKAEKVKLERDIKSLLDGFTLRTGLHPTRIDLEVVECRPLNGGVLAIVGDVTVEVKL